MASHTSSRGHKMPKGMAIDGLKVKPVLDIQECLRDTPKFRAALDEQLHTIDNLDGKLEKLLKASHGMIDSGKSYIDSQHSFCNSLTELSVYFRQDQFVYNGFGKCTAGLMELAKFHSTLLDQINRAICRNIGDFLKVELRAMKEVRSSHEKYMSEYDSALNRNSAIPRGKNLEAEEAINALSTARTNFRYSALKMVFSISVLQQRKRFDILDNLLAVMNGYRTFFHQGSDYYKDGEPTLKAISLHLNEMRSATIRDADQTAFLGNCSQIVLTTPDYLNGALVPADCIMQGYLFKRSSNKTFKSWKRRWFELMDAGQLVFRKRADDVPTVMEDDLRICLVRPMADTDRRFCFELISPNKTHILQADGEDIFQAWVSALQLAIQSAIHNSTSTRTSDPSSPPQQQSASQLLQLTAEKAKVIKSILKVDGNNECCDCGASDPEWASANLGITLCIECSGIHRSLGVHYSKVKSLKLDSWEPGMLKVMGELGNNLVNRIYLAKADVVDTLGVARATPSCTREIRETWIRVKYVDRAFVAPPKLNGDSGTGPGKKLIRKWSVRKPFRRQRNRSGGSSGKASRESSLLVSPEASAMAGASAGGLEDSSETESFKSCKSKGTTASSASDVEGGVLVFGADLPPSQTEVVGHLADAEGEESAEDETDARDNGTEESVETLDANMLLYRASRVANLGVMSEAIALGADKNWTNSKEEFSTPLHQAIYGGSVTACEFLILNGARINATDGKLRTPLLVATELGHTGQICLFLRNRADHHMKDVDGRTAIDVAVASEHADIVTLLRLAQMDEEMRVGETSQTDDSFQEIVRDIAQRAQDEQSSPSTTRVSPNI